jgi:hypothetical protein
MWYAVCAGEIDRPLTDKPMRNILEKRGRMRERSTFKVRSNVNQYVIVVEFLSSPNGLIFYMAHVFLVHPGFPQSTQTLQAAVTADTPELALREAEYLAWLLNL